MWEKREGEKKGKGGQRSGLEGRAPGDMNLPGPRRTPETRKKKGGRGRSYDRLTPNCFSVLKKKKRF